LPRAISVLRGRGSRRSREVTWPNDRCYCGIEHGCGMSAFPGVEERRAEEVPQPELQGRVMASPLDAVLEQADRLGRVAVQQCAGAVLQQPGFRVGELVPCFGPGAQAGGGGEQRPPERARGITVLLA
jgi:hypothetical protein